MSSKEIFPFLKQFDLLQGCEEIVGEPWDKIQMIERDHFGTERLLEELKSWRVKDPGATYWSSLLKRTKKRLNEATDQAKSSCRKFYKK